MTFVNTLFNTNFLEYASYVIKDRAIPHIADGLKPVQRRILYTLFEMDDGKFHKVANAVGRAMQYHPHGDASIYSALVVLANKDLFIEKQGNFGNIYTGDEASAARYIECRLTALARETLFNPDTTAFELSYDSRHKEPITLPAKLPVMLIIGAEGIAVGMATKILPHNFLEVLRAEIACLRGEKFQLFPDFPTGGLCDVSEYADGNGKVRIRAELDTSDEKRIVVRQIPYGTTTASLIASVESAARHNKIKIASISDFTAEAVEIEIHLARGMHTAETVDALYAFTDCEVSVPLSFMVIDDSNKPVVITATDLIQHAAGQLVDLLKAELKIEDKRARDKLHARTLERIFIEERIYKRIEEMATAEDVVKAVYKGFGPFKDQVKRPITDEDVEALLAIPIRRISRYDINRAQKEIAEINKRLKEIKHSLDNIIVFTIDYLEGLCKKYAKQFPRKTKLVSFEKVDVREVAQRNLKLRYDHQSGYLGYEVNGGAVCDVSTFDRVLTIRKSGVWSVINAPDKLFVDKGMWWCGFVNKDIVYTLVYRDNKNGRPYIKRCSIEKFILNKPYSLVPDGSDVLKLTTAIAGTIHLEYKPKPYQRIAEESFEIADYPVRGNKAGGIRLSPREIKSAHIEGAGGQPEPGET
ncbi:MAG: DNA topoisomerase IV subunit A [Chitinivibrionales bacterium]|nr:DNA topoisomerase IV subunit A [Chitinivibrionales bacterium]